MARCRCDKPGREKDWNMSGCAELRQLKADALLLAEIVTKDHQPKCTYSPTDGPECLWDIGEVCSIRMSGKDGCKWWKSCDCEACKVASRLTA